MIRLIIKLALAALIAHAAWRLGSAYASFYKFKDSVEQTAQYGPDKSNAELKARVLELASQYDIPLDEDDLTIELKENHTIIDGQFSNNIELVPGYKRPWPFSFHVDAFVIRQQRTP